MHSLSKVIHKNRHLMLNRLPPSPPGQKVKVFINFAILKFTKPIDSEVAVFDCLLTNSPNNLIRELINLLFSTFDKRLELNKSENAMFALQVGEKMDFLAGEDPIYCYEEVMAAHQLRRDIKLRLVELSRREHCDCSHMLYGRSTIENYTLMVNPDQPQKGFFKDILLWRFPMDIYNSAPEKPQEGENMIDRQVEDKNKDLNVIREQTAKKLKKSSDLRSYSIAKLVPDVFMSSDIRNQVKIRILKLSDLHLIFSKQNFIKSNQEHTRFGPLPVT